VCIGFLEVGDDFIRARMPVDSRTRQPDDLLHGGEWVAPAEPGAAPAVPPGTCAVGLDKTRLQPLA